MGLSPKQRATCSYEAITKRLAAQAQEYCEPQLSELGFLKHRLRPNHWMI